MVETDFGMEKKIIDFWNREKIYKFDVKSKKKIYSIDTPPPTVSGRMHIGHAFSYSQQDFIARYKRMRGFNVFYPFGTDDNGLATEKLVQKKKNVDLRRKTREEAIKICLEFLKEELPEFVQDWKNIGVSCDFDVQYSTIDKHSIAVSQKSFLDLAKKGFAYRKEAPILWDPVFQTAIAQAELQDKEMKSYFNDLIFKTEDGKELIIATTRPELLGACVAVFVNPNDKRYKKIIGKKAITPIYNARVPIMTDERVDVEKGTGIVMCCTFGDLTDVEWYKQYNLPLKMLINPDGKMNERSGKYSGMKIIEARKNIIEDLKNLGLLKHQREISHVVQVGERSGEPIEIINSRQWYIKYLDRKKTFLKASKELKWHPEHMRNKLDNWIKGLQWDWSISRQRHFGVPIPVWFCKNCGETIFADEKQLPVNPLKDNPKPCGKCKSKDFIPEKDVFDTWFTSASSPFLAITLMPKEIQGKLFPMSLRPQAHDIINFWLFYTMAKTQLLENKNPWENVTISGWALDSKGEKMSKSKGNVIEPQEIVKKFGADSIRYWASSSKLGEDISYQEKEIISGKKLANKIINASNFVFMNMEDYNPKKANLLETDRLFLAMLNKTIEKATESFDNYEYHVAKQETDNFFWQIFCNNYLEIVKKRVYAGSNEEKESAFYVLYNSLLALLKLYAPIIPFATEDVYQKYFRKNEKDKSIHISSWPEKFDVKKKKDDDEIFELLIKTIANVRQEKSVAKKSMNAEIILTLGKKEIEKLKLFLEDLKSVANAREIREGKFGVEFV